MPPQPPPLRPQARLNDEEHAGENSYARPAANTAPIGLCSAPDLGHATFSSEPDDPCTPNPPGTDTAFLTTADSYKTGAPAPQTPLQSSTLPTVMLPQAATRHSFAKAVSRSVITLPTSGSSRNVSRTMWTRAHASGVWQGQAIATFGQLVAEWDSLRTELEQHRPSHIASPRQSVACRGRTGRPTHDAISMALDKLVQLEHSTLQSATVNGRRTSGRLPPKQAGVSCASVCCATNGAATGILGSGFRASGILGESGVQKLPVGALDTNVQTEPSILEGGLQANAVLGDVRGTGTAEKGGPHYLASPRGSGTLDWGAQARGDLESEDYGPAMLESGPPAPGDTVDSYKSAPKDQTNVTGQSTLIDKAFLAAGIYDSGGTVPVPFWVRKAQGAIDALDTPAPSRHEQRLKALAVPSAHPSANALSDSCQETIGGSASEGTARLASAEMLHKQQQQQQQHQRQHRLWQQQQLKADAAPPPLGKPAHGAVPYGHVHRRVH
jgi:hypothetical protein